MLKKSWLFEFGMLVWLGLVIYGFSTAWTLPLVSVISVLTLAMKWVSSVLFLAVYILVK